jgi:bacteriocin-like protein
MKELSIEKMESIQGGCSMEEMMAYAFLSNWHASQGNMTQSFIYGARLMGCI